MRGVPSDLALIDRLETTLRPGETRTVTHYIAVGSRDAR